jgi:hypothetical protein
VDDVDEAPAPDEAFDDIAKSLPPDADEDDGRG